MKHVWRIICVQESLRRADERIEEKDQSNENLRNNCDELQEKAQQLSLLIKEVRSVLLNTVDSRVHWFVIEASDVILLLAGYWLLSFIVWIFLC